GAGAGVASVSPEASEALVWPFPLQVAAVIPAAGSLTATLVAVLGPLSRATIVDVVLSPGVAFTFPARFAGSTGWRSRRGGGTKSGGLTNTARRGPPPGRAFGGGGARESGEVWGHRPQRWGPSRPR